MSLPLEPCWLSWELLLPSSPHQPEPGRCPCRYQTLWVLAELSELPVSKSWLTATVRRQLKLFNTPRGRSCSAQVRPPSACLPGLHAGIFRCGLGWRAGRVRAAPGRNPRAPRRQNTPARRCSRTRSGRWHLQGRMDKVNDTRSMSRWCGRRTEEQSKKMKSPLDL